MTGNEIYNLLINEIREGRVSGRLPSIARMTAMYGTSHSTVQLVLDKLKLQGLVYGQKGKGIFVCETAPVQHKISSVMILITLKHFLRNQFYIRMLIMLKERLSEAGFNLVLNTELTDDMSHYAAAVITSANLMSAEQLKKLKFAFGSRICLLNHKLDGFVSVSNNNFQGGWLAAERLYDAGHRHIGVVTCYLDMPYSFFFDRLEGVLAFARRHRNLKITEFPVSGDEDAPDVAVTGREILENHPGITGIFTFKDIFASELQQIFKQAGRQISLIGYGNSPYGSFLTPALTSIEEDAAGLGAALSRTVYDLMVGKETRSVDVPVKLIERESVFTWQEPEKGKSAKRCRNN